MPDGLHVNGRELPEGYVPIELSLEENENVRLHSVDYPEPEVIELPALDERLPVYTGRVEIKARCLGTMRTREEEVVQVTANLRYQACDDHQCFAAQPPIPPRSAERLRSKARATRGICPDRA